MAVVVLLEFAPGQPGHDEAVETDQTEAVPDFDRLEIRRGEHFPAGVTAVPSLDCICPALSDTVVTKQWENCLIVRVAARKRS